MRKQQEGKSAACRKGAACRPKHRIAVLHDGIGQGQVKEPELDDKIPGGFGKRKGIRIKFKEIGYESILISGMTAGVNR